MKSKTELLHFGKKAKRGGKKWLSSVCFSAHQIVQKVTDTTLEMEYSGENLKRKKIPRIDISKSFCLSECDNGCGGE